MDTSTTQKLKELVTSSRFREAEQLLTDLLSQSPNDYPLLMHMAGVQSSMNRFSAAESYYKRAIDVGGLQSGSAKVQLMRIYSQQSRYKDLISLLLQCLESEEKSISLKEQLIQVYLAIFEYESALFYSRRLLEQIKAADKWTAANSKESAAALTAEQRKCGERAKVLMDPLKRSDFCFLHSQILCKVGRFSDALIYCKKAVSVLESWTNSMSPPQRNMMMTAYSQRQPMVMGFDPNQKRLSLEYNQRMNRHFGYLGLLHLHVDDVENALKCFKKALAINPLDRIAKSNVQNISQNRGLFDKFSHCEFGHRIHALFWCKDFESVFPSVLCLYSHGVRWCHAVTFQSGLMLKMFFIFEPLASYLDLCFMPTSDVLS